MILALIDLVSSLTIEAAWGMSIDYATDLLDAAAVRLRRANRAAGSTRPEDVSDERYVGDGGVVHAPGVSRLIRMLGH